MKQILFLDDIREPSLIYGEPENVQFHVVRDFKSFKQWILTHGLPDCISFDHDLGLDYFQRMRESGMSKRGFKRLRQSDHFPSGMDAAKWLVEYCLDQDLSLPEWKVHSANPAGADNIRGLLSGFDKFRGKYLK